ncbi:MAG: rhodanese-like domain-containing protein, partial [Spirochaetota bacterium]
KEKMDVMEQKPLKEFGMKRKVFSGAVLSIGLLAVCIFFAACKSQAGQRKADLYADPDKLAELIKSGSKDYYLIDVRTPEEYKTGYIPTAINIPVNVIQDKLSTQDRQALIILYCRSGARSGRALNTLKDLGFINLVNFGGITKWKGSLVTPE